jgi:hypothetical protein
MTRSTHDHPTAKQRILEAADYLLYTRGSTALPSIASSRTQVACQPQRDPRLRQLAHPQQVSKAGGIANIVLTRW